MRVLRGHSGRVGGRCLQGRDLMKASAGALCRDTDFQVFLGAESEDAATDILRTKLGIQSRTEFDNNADARVAFVKLREEFQLWLKTK